jgi:two-component system, OmpR family, response regulator
VLDLSGSEWDGLSPLHRLRADAVTDVPVLVLSARAEASDRIAGLHAGADDYLGKPFHLPELIARLANLARRSGPRPTPSGPQLRAGDLLLDEDTREVRRGEDLIHLSPKEFAVLNLFMRNPMRVLGRAEIHRQVWGEHGEGSDKIVEIYLCQLRKKIDRGGAPMIHTLRGAGYILKAAPSAVPAVEGSR